MKVTTRKLHGDDRASWAVFVDGRPAVTGLTSDEATHHRSRIETAAAERERYEYVRVRADELEIGDNLCDYGDVTALERNRDGGVYVEADEIPVGAFKAGHRLEIRRER